ncbi:MAG: ABC transporter permease [Ignavibacteria bacterium]|nr:ABC transporter permease [Ignavibacteria bacterium]
MKGALAKLYLIELRRQWTVAAVFVPVGLMFLSAVILFTSAKFSKTYDVARFAASVNISLVVPLAAALFGVALVAVDVKDGWLRTLLIRPVSRQNYLLIKMAAVYTSVVFTIVIAGILPNVIVSSFFAKGEVVFDLGRVLAVHGVLLLQAMLIVSILTFFSCWMPGVFNVVLIAFWSICASAISGYIQAFHAMDKWLTILKDFLFPDGFSKAVDAINGGMGAPLADLAWGFGALGLILALTFWSITKIQVDKGSE